MRVQLGSVILLALLFGCQGQLSQTFNQKEQSGEIKVAVSNRQAPPSPEFSLPVANDPAQLPSVNDPDPSSWKHEREILLNVWVGEQPLAIHAKPYSQSVKLGELEPRSNIQLVKKVIGRGWYQLAGSEGYVFAGGFSRYDRSAVLRQSVRDFAEIIWRRHQDGDVAEGKILLEVIGFFSSLQQSDRAKALLRLVKGGNTQRGAEILPMRIMADAGQLNAALELYHDLDQLGDELVQRRAFASLGKAFIKAGKYEEFLRFMEAFTPESKRIQRLYHHTGLREAMANAAMKELQRIGNFEEVERFLELKDLRLGTTLDYGPVLLDYFDRKGLEFTLQNKIRPAKREKWWDLLGLSRYLAYHGRYQDALDVIQLEETPRERRALLGSLADVIASCTVDYAALYDIFPDLNRSIEEVDNLQYKGKKDRFTAAPWIKAMLVAKTGTFRDTASIHPPVDKNIRLVAGTTDLIHLQWMTDWLNDFGAQEELDRHLAKMRELINFQEPNRRYQASIFVAGEYARLAQPEQMMAILREEISEEERTKYPSLAGKVFGQLAQAGKLAEGRQFSAQYFEEHLSSDKATLRQLGYFIEDYGLIFDRCGSAGMSITRRAAKAPDVDFPGVLELIAKSHRRVTNREYPHSGDGAVLQLANQLSSMAESYAFGGW